jgi:uncharacterized protein (TIGR00369 family)
MTEEKQKLMLLTISKSEMLKLYQGELLTLETDFVSLKIPRLSFSSRQSGMFNGAVISSLVDISSGLAAVSHYEEDVYVVTVELKVNFLQPAMGDCLISKSKVIRGGKKISVIQTDIYSPKKNEETSNKHVATSLVTMMRIK